MTFENAKLLGKIRDQFRMTVSPPHSIVIFFFHFT